MKRKGRKISDAKQDLVLEILPKIEIKDLENDVLLEELKSEQEKPVNLEIGYGSGEHLAMQAEYHDDEIFVGCEPYFNGTAKLLTEIRNREIENIIIYQDDALLLLDELPDNFLSKLFILFPDPWPKRRHYKRRIIKEENIKIFAKKLKPGGLLRIATDHANYASWIIAKMIKSESFDWEADKVGDWYKEPKEWTSTKYQRKALAGDTYYFFDFKKLT